MEALEKIRAFLARLEDEKNIALPKLVFFSDCSCGIVNYRDRRIIVGKNIESLLKEIDNYQWETNTDNQNTAPAKQ